MTLFLGKYQHKVDSKGRLVLPRKIVEGVDERADGSHFVITLGLDPCLYLFTRKGFLEHVANMRQAAFREGEYRGVMRGIGALSQEQSPDSQGRIALPAELRERVQLGNEVVVVGAIDHVEIWDHQRWETSAAAQAEQTYLDRADQYFRSQSQLPGVEK